MNPFSFYPFKMFGKFNSYMANMPYINTDQFAGRCHECPICGAYVWSCWANARKHWEVHEEQAWSGEGDE